jgi:hypothetical protein
MEETRSAVERVEFRVLRVERRVFAVACAAVVSVCSSAVLLARAVMVSSERASAVFCRERRTDGVSVWVLRVVNVRGDGDVDV